METTTTLLLRQEGGGLLAPEPEFFLCAFFVPAFYEVRGPERDQERSVFAPPAPLPVQVMGRWPFKRSRRHVPLSGITGVKIMAPLHSLHTAVFFSLQSLCLMQTGKPTRVAVSHCITWFQTELILTTFQIHYHSH